MTKHTTPIDIEGIRSIVKGKYKFARTGPHPNLLAIRDMPLKKSLCLR